MSEVPFKVKDPALLGDGLTSWSRVHPDVQRMLLWVCDFARERHWVSPPVVTCFGRLKRDQEAIYLPAMLQALEHEGVIRDSLSVEQARERARSKFSWHCIGTSGTAVGFSRAFDLRYWVWSEPQRAELLEAARRKWPTAELLDHAVPGGSRHLHLGLPDPAGRPVTWL